MVVNSYQFAKKFVSIDNYLKIPFNFVKTIIIATAIDKYIIPFPI